MAPLTLLPMQLQVCDRFVDESGEWEVVTHPVVVSPLPRGEGGVDGWRPSRSFHDGNELLRPLWPWARSPDAMAHRYLSGAWKGTDLALGGVVAIMADHGCAFEEGRAATFNAVLKGGRPAGVAQSPTKLTPDATAVSDKTRWAPS